LFVENQGRFANPSVRSVEAALEQAVTERGVSVQFVLLADNPDEQTRTYLENHRPKKAEVLLTAFNSRAQAVEHALKHSEGALLALSSTHDLVSSNWLSSAYAVCEEDRGRKGLEKGKASWERTVVHPATIISFGERTFLYIVPDQANPDFSTDVLLARNPWPGPAFGATETFRQNPIREPDESRGFGESDWLWVCDTIANGVIHKPVAETFSCCHRRWGHACVSLRHDGSLLMPSSRLFNPAVGR